MSRPTKANDHAANEHTTIKAAAKTTTKAKAEPRSPQRRINQSPGEEAAATQSRSQRRR